MSRSPNEGNEPDVKTFKKPHRIAQDERKGLKSSTVSLSEKTREKGKLRPKILYLDIETSPLVCLTWGMWQTDVAKLIKDYYILCIAYQWEGKKMQFIRTRGNDKTLCLAIHALISEADIIVAQNGDSFDLKKINARFAYWGLTPPPAYKTIDTLKILKSKFGLTRNSLDFVCDYFGIGKKLKHQGIDLWDNCMKDPDHKDWAIMEKYNRRDVWLLRQLWLQKLQPWHKTAPKVGHACPKCGSSEGHWRGVEWRATQKYRRWFCRSCGKSTVTDIKTPVNGDGG